VSCLLGGQVDVVHDAIVRHNGESFVFFVESNRLQFVVYFNFGQAQVVIEELGHRFQKAERWLRIFNVLAVVDLRLVESVLLFLDALFNRFFRREQVD